MKRILNILRCALFDKHLLDTSCVVSDPNKWHRVRCKHCKALFYYTPNYEGGIGAIHDKYNNVFSLIINK